MFDQIVRFVRNALQPYDNQIAALIHRIEELERCKDNLIKPGKVTAIHPDGKKIRVEYDNNVTPWIKWFATAAGVVSDYRCPSVGEQCALLNYGGGEDSAQVWALCGLPSNLFPLPGDGTTTKRVTSYPGNIQEVIDVASGRVTLTTPHILVEASGTTVFDTPDLHGTGEVSDSVRTNADDRVIYDGHKHIANGAPTSIPDPLQG